LKRFFLLLAFTPVCALAQTGFAYDSTMTQADSLSVFRLIDSLITALDEEPPGAQVVFRTGYNSNDTGQGSAFQLNQYGLSLGASYYHPTGFFADVAGYYSNTYEPQYYLTMATAGYTYSGTKKFSFNVEYRKSFYHFDPEDFSPFPRLPTSFISNFSSGVYSNNLTGTIYFEHKTINMRMDYSFLFDGSATPIQRIAPTASINWERRGWLKTDKISVFPSLSWVYGSGLVPTYEPLYKTRLEALFRTRNGLPLFEQVNATRWGTLNLALSLPISIAWKKWSVMGSYTYNWPQTLPGETYLLDDGGYITVSVLRYITLKRKRNS
jgi:hypothetical protein